MIYYKDLKSGNFYRFKNGKVLTCRAGIWRESWTVKPADLAHYPFVGLRMQAPGAPENDQS